MCGGDKLQTLLDNIKRHITINDINYFDSVLHSGEKISVFINSITIQDVEVGKTYKFLIDNSYIGESSVQVSFSHKWNKGEILYEQEVKGEVIGIRANMVKISSDNFCGWVLNKFIEAVY